MPLKKQKCQFVNNNGLRCETEKQWIWGDRRDRRYGLCTKHRDLVVSKQNTHELEMSARTIRLKSDAEIQRSDAAIWADAITSGD